MNSHIRQAPKGLAILALVGPSFIWCAEYIGSGEVILATRAGAILGPSVLWAVILGTFLKFWIGMSGARYTVCTGEGMVDMFSRIPGPRNWAVWLVLVAQFAAATVSIGSLASAAGVFLSQLLPGSPFVWGWIVTMTAFAVVWNGSFDLLKGVMSFLVLVIVAGVLYVAVGILPGLSDFWSFRLPTVPDWALSPGQSPNPWREVLPLVGWAAGGFASQVWYTYWVLGAGYGAASGKAFGQPADVASLNSLTKRSAARIKTWCRLVYVDSTIALLIGTVVTAGFVVAGAGVLRPQQLAPEGETVAITLSAVFSSKWGTLGGLLFMISGATAMIGTQIGQLAGWPRLLADCFRICFPKVQRIPWQTQFRVLLITFVCTNMLIVYTFGVRPVFLIQLAALLDGLILTPLQALWVLFGLFFVMPRLLSAEGWEELKPHWCIAAGLIAAFVVFAYFCLFQIPFL